MVSIGKSCAGAMVPGLYSTVARREHCLYLHTCPCAARQPRGTLGLGHPWLFHWCDEPGGFVQFVSLPFAFGERERCTPGKDSILQTPTLGATAWSLGSRRPAGRRWHKFLLLWKGTEGV